MTEGISEISMEIIERVVVLMYCRTSELSKVNDARKQLFTQSSHMLENIPPTQAALEQHIKRGRYQCYSWSACSGDCQDLDLRYTLTIFDITLSSLYIILQLLSIQIRMYVTDNQN